MLAYWPNQRQYVGPPFILRALIERVNETPKHSSSLPQIRLIALNVLHSYVCLSLLTLECKVSGQNIIGIYISYH